MFDTSGTDSHVRPLILLADDNRVNRLVVRSTFKTYDYDFVEAVNGAEALALAEEHQPDLILMDLMMPEMDGLEATRRLKQNPRTDRIPILMLTALNESEDRIQAFEAGAMAFVSKPFDRLELLAHVRSYLSYSLINKKYILSTADPVTQLPNRAALRDALGDANPLLMAIKMDDLEAVTRLYGEQTAAEVERDFASFLLDVASDIFSHTTVYQLSRGTFGLVRLEDGDADRAEAMALAGHIAERLRDHHSAVSEVQHRQDYTIAVAVGAEKLIERAELTLDHVMQSRTGVGFADDVVPQAHREFEENLMWLGRIRSAVNEDRIVPWFQPIAEINGGRIVKYEALARILCENGDVLSPGQFMRVAKGSRYYPEITRSVIEKSLMLFKDRREDLSLNLSVLDIETESTREMIFDALSRYPDVASRLTLEIVEQEGIQHYGAVKEFVEIVRSHGVTLALDDFGSGYSNFKTVIDLNIDYLKIDGSIIQRVCDDAVIKNLLEVIQSFAAFSGIRVIAEFVDSDEILDYLQSKKVEFAQGFRIGRPGPLSS